ncbi:LysR family transcriptional regulator [Mycobacterium sp. MS1601]|uniref:SDR family oxidoreductase n=1 Tax=Mycobacterium sp. MS1601 TaxID=1936029 RepID=UPI0009791FA4|nr:SDR family oxidoreductase [Mycobacterium sp. MS1601]AQA01107.1 LysR family transcriptional regulator [Mycobacterium sp. MS1601]
MTRIAVVGATGLIGTQVVALLEAGGHTVAAVSRASGVDVLTGSGVDEALAGAEVLVDVLNSPSFEDGPVLDFFSTSTAVLVAAARRAGIAHYVALSIVGVDRLPDSGYMRAKVVQENVIVESGMPYTIVRATQFHEFTAMITEGLIIDGEVRAPDARIQPIASAAVAARVAEAAVAQPLNGVVNIGGPDTITFAEMARLVLTAQGRDLPVLVDPAASYFGARVDANSLVTAGDAGLMGQRFADWLG